MVPKAQQSHLGTVAGHGSCHAHLTAHAALKSITLRVIALRAAANDLAADVTRRRSLRPLEEDPALALGRLETALCQRVKLERSVRLFAQVAPEQIRLGMKPLKIAADRDRLGKA